jgi:GTP pyrophosphokinase
VDRFGERVANIVRDCSDAEPEPGQEKEAWRPRKERYLSELRNYSNDSLLVSGADKLHNARAILADYRILGEALWLRFNSDSDQLWYYRALVGVFREVGTPLADEVDRVVSELEVLVKQRR